MFVHELLMSLRKDVSSLLVYDILQKKKSKTQEKARKKELSIKL